MCKSCIKLPEKIERNKDEKYPDFLKRIYPVYQRDISDAHLVLHGKRIDTKKDLSYNLRQVGFEHITNSVENDELFNWRRSKRINWLPVLISLVDQNDCCQDIRVFTERSRSTPGGKDMVIWCSSVDYIIILGIRSDSFILRSAYCVIYKTKREKLEKQWKKYVDGLV